MTLLVTIFLSSILAFSQKIMPDSEKTDFQVISQQGSLFSLKVVRGEPIKIFVLGKEEAEIDLSKIELSADLDTSDMSLSIRQVNPKPGKILTLTRFKDHFEINEPLKMEKELVLEVKASQKNKNETFKVKMNTPK